MGCVFQGDDCLSFRGGGGRLGDTLRDRLWEDPSGSMASTFPIVPLLCLVYVEMRSPTQVKGVM